MCSKQQVKEAVNEVLHETVEDGSTYIGREVSRYMDRKATQIISTLTLRFAIPAVGFVVAMAGAWFSLSNRVETNTEHLQETLTQDQAALIIQSVANLTNRVDEQNELIKELSERLRNKGI